MKKLIAFVLILICLSFIALAKSEEKAIFDIDNISKVCLVSSQNCTETESVACGNSYFNYCSLSMAKELYKKIDVDAVQLYLEDYSFDKFKHDYNLQIVSILEKEDLKVVNAYSSCFGNSVLIDGKKVNVQIAVYEDSLLAGFPIILTGY